MAQALALPLGTAFSQAHYFGPPEQEVHQEMFPAFKADYDDGLELDAVFPSLGGDIGAWEQGGVLDPCFLHDDQLDATTPMASLSDDSDDGLLPNSSSTSSLDSSGSGGSCRTFVAPAAAVAPVGGAAAFSVPTAARSCRAGAGPRAAAPSSFYPSGDPSGAHLTREERVQRYREKRKRRTFEKTIRYEARRAYAEVRPRIKGRFATKAEVAAMKAAKAAGVPFEC